MLQQFRFSIKPSLPPFYCDVYVAASSCPSIPSNFPLISILYFLPKKNLEFFCRLESLAFVHRKSQLSPPLEMIDESNDTVNAHENKFKLDIIVILTKNVFTRFTVSLERSFRKLKKIIFRNPIAMVKN